ncbi:hypothetical protein J2Y60_004412 [Arcicella sp. BE140]|nr:hypothetical protein [Arcicella sp. BE51]MDR6814195.1 hypothetical protein [Arcicella sp. BE140]MDR6825566.1 hypothetical protein [Arcicella sp. BE139]
MKSNKLNLAKRIVSNLENTNNSKLIKAKEVTHLTSWR